MKNILLALLLTLSLASACIDGTSDLSMIWKKGQIIQNSTLTVENKTILEEGIRIKQAPNGRTPVEPWIYITFKKHRDIVLAITKSKFKKIKSFKCDGHQKHKKHKKPGKDKIQRGNILGGKNIFISFSLLNNLFYLIEGKICGNIFIESVK